MAITPVRSGGRPRKPTAGRRQSLAFRFLSLKDTVFRSSELRLDYTMFCAKLQILRAYFAAFAQITRRRGTTHHPFLLYFLTFAPVLPPFPFLSSLSCRAQRALVPKMDKKRNLWYNLSMKRIKETNKQTNFASPQPHFASPQPYLDVEVVVHHHCARTLHYTDAAALAVAAAIMGGCTVEQALAAMDTPSWLEEILAANTTPTFRLGGTNILD